MSSLKAVHRLFGQSGEERIAVIKPRQHERVDECLCDWQVEEMADSGNGSKMEKSKMKFRHWETGAMDVEPMVRERVGSEPDLLFGATRKKTVFPMLSFIR